MQQFEIIFLTSAGCIGWMCAYLVYKQAPLGWIVVQGEDVQVSSGGEARLHHGNKRLQRDACDLRSDDYV